MNPALLVIVLLSVAAAQPACDTSEQCDASTLVGGDGDPAVSLLQHEALLKKKINVHGRDDGEVEGEVEVPESLVSGAGAANTVRNNLQARKTKLDINQKAYIEGQAVLGDGAGQGNLNVCMELA